MIMCTFRGLGISTERRSLRLVSWRGVRRINWCKESSIGLISLDATDSNTGTIGALPQDVLQDSSSKETKEKMAARKRGVPMKPEVRQRISEAHKGKPKSEEWRSHLWDNRRGYKHSEETRKKMSQAAERRRLLGLHPKGRPVSDKVKAAMSARFKGVPKSPEHRAKIAAALKLFWAKGRKPNDLWRSDAGSV
jgi:hypothetical protein